MYSWFTDYWYYIIWNFWKLKVNHLAVHSLFSGQINYEGSNYLSLAGEFGEDYQTLANYQYNIYLDADTPLDLWPEFRISGDCSVRYVIKGYPVAPSPMQEWVYDETVYDKPLILDTQDSYYLSISIQAKGQGIVKIGPLHHRDSHLGYGDLLVGGNRIIDKNREFLKKWLGWLDFYHSKQDVIDFTQVCLNNEKNKISLPLAIYYNGKFAGSIELKDLDFRNKKTEIGYWLAKEFTGKGIMVKTTKFMIDYAFNELNLNRISILTATENYASQAIPEKLGFTKEGMLEDNECLYGKFLDNYIYGMTKEKWNNVNN